MSMADTTSSEDVDLLDVRYLLFVLSLENDAFILVVVLAVSKKLTFSKLIRSLKHNSNIDFLGVWVSERL